MEETTTHRRPHLDRAPTARSRLLAPAAVVATLSLLLAGCGGSGGQSGGGQSGASRGAGGMMGGGMMGRSGATTAPPATATESAPTGTATESAPTGTTSASASEEAGRTLFLDSGCGGCHTLAAAGTTGTAGPNLDRARPDYQLVRELVTDGKGAMPPFSGSLTTAQIDRIARFVADAVSGS